MVSSTVPVMAASPSTSLPISSELLQNALLLQKLAEKVQITARLAAIDAEMEYMLANAASVQTCDDIGVAVDDGRKKLDEPSSRGVAALEPSVGVPLLPAHIFPEIQQPASDTFLVSPQGCLQFPEPPAEFAKIIDLRDDLDANDDESVSPQRRQQHFDRNGNGASVHMRHCAGQRTRTSSHHHSRASACQRWPRTTSCSPPSASSLRHKVIPLLQLAQAVRGYLEKAGRPLLLSDIGQHLISEFGRDGYDACIETYCAGGNQGTQFGVPKASLLNLVSLMHSQGVLVDQQSSVPGNHPRCYLEGMDLNCNGDSEGPQPTGPRQQAEEQNARTDLFDDGYLAAGPQPVPVAFVAPAPPPCPTAGFAPPPYCIPMPIPPMPPMAMCYGYPAPWMMMQPYPYFGDAVAANPRITRRGLRGLAPGSARPLRGDAFRQSRTKHQLAMQHQSVLERFLLARGGRCRISEIREDEQKTITIFPPELKEMKAGDFLRWAKSLEQRGELVVTKVEGSENDYELALPVIPSSGP